MTSRSLADRLFEKVRWPLSPEGIPWADPDDCWEFTGFVSVCTRGKYRWGYGQIRESATERGVRGRLIKAHRASYVLFHGPIPDGWDVAHACDNPICVNPAHLYAATHKANIYDYIYKYGGIGRPKSAVSLTQLRLFRERGEEPFLSEIVEVTVVEDGEPDPWGTVLSAGDRTVGPGEAAGGTAMSPVRSEAEELGVYV